MGFKTRLWCFTNFNLEFDYVDYFDKHKVTYLIYGLETCPTTGKQHHQGAVYFKSQRGSIKGVAKELNGAHVEMCKGTIDDNVKYCSKDGNVTEMGDRPNQGARQDIYAMKDLIVSGDITVDDIIMENPDLYHKYGRTFNAIEDIALRKKFRTEMTECDWLYGPTGVGKSHTAFTGYNPSTHYILPLMDNGWWDGYKGQPFVIINEFRGQIQFSELLDLIDKWPKTVKRRNREPVPFLAKKIIITSCMEPDEVYSGVATNTDSINQLYRRINLIKLNKTHNPNYGSKVL